MVRKYRSLSKKEPASPGSERSRSGVRRKERRRILRKNILGIDTGGGAFTTHHLAYNVIEICGVKSRRIHGKYTREGREKPSPGRIFLEYLRNFSLEKSCGLPRKANDAGLLSKDPEFREFFVPCSGGGFPGQARENIREAPCTPFLKERGLFEKPKEAGRPEEELFVPMLRERNAFQDPEKEVPEGFPFGKGRKVPGNAVLCGEEAGFSCLHTFAEAGISQGLPFRASTNAEEE
jgi:hypothetical protein